MTRPRWKTSAQLATMPLRDRLRNANTFGLDAVSRRITSALSSVEQSSRITRMKSWNSCAKMLSSASAMKREPL